MALEVSMTGTGTIGNITPNWTVNEFATPVTIGASTGGTGSVSFSAKANDDSLLCINNDVVSTVNGFGAVHGVVQSVNQSGLNVSLTHGTLLDKFNLDLDMPPMLGGDVVCALDYFEQEVLGVARTNRQNNLGIQNQFFTLAGHAYCFLKDGEGKAVYQQPSNVPTVPFFDFEGAPYYYFNDIRNTLSVSNFLRSNGKIYGNDITGYTLMIGGGFSDFDIASNLFYKTLLNGSDNIFSFSGNPTSYGYEWLLDCNLTVDYSAETISLSGLYAPGGDETPFSASASIATLDRDAELAIFFQHYVEVGGPYQLRATICNTSDYATYVTVTFELAYGSTPVIDSWTIDGLARDVYIEVNTTPDPTLEPYEYGVASTLYVDESTNTVGNPAVAYSGVFWEYLQMGCAAKSQEIAVDGDIVYVRNVGERTFDITNVVASPAMNPTSTLSGKQINIPYSNSAFVDGIVYDAASDGNNIISVAAGATTITSVKHTVNPITLLQPSISETWPIEVNQYYVIDSAGVRLLASEWYGYGGSVSVNIDPDDPAAIQITVVGPYTEVTLAGGPYELAASDGANKYASLKIGGTGVYAGESVLGLLTGIDPEKYTRATVNTISNPFISTEAEAYDRGLWAAQKASGPVITLSAQIPASSIDGIGLTCGSLVNYRNSTYRIVSCSISGIAASITAERHVTVDDVNSIWGVGQVTKAVTISAVAGNTTFTSASHGFVDGDPITINSVGRVPGVTYTVPISGVETVSGTNRFRYYYTNAAPGPGYSVSVTGYSTTQYNVTNQEVLARTDTYFEVAGNGSVYSSEAGPGTAVWGQSKLTDGYVVNAATDTFKLAAYPGGSAFTTSGFYDGTYTATTSTYSATDYDSFWGNYECQDQIIFPYLEA